MAPTNSYGITGRNNNSLVKDRCFGQFLAGQSRPLMAVIEITNRCNMHCPLCFSNSNHDSGDVPLAEIQRRMEQLLAITGTPVNLQLSGGEPTLHPDLPRIIALARNLGFRNLELISNGIKISRNPDYLSELKAQGLKSVYLQFDGLKASTYLKLRGWDMTAVRRQALENIRRAGMCCTLAVAVARGVNDDELGDIARFGIDNLDVVRAINFQSVSPFSGRFLVGEEHGGYRLPELIKLIAAQTGLPADTFLSEHLPHPLCNAMSLVYVVNGRLEPLFKYIRLEDIKKFLGDNSREKILGLFDGKKAFFRRYLSHPRAWKLIAKAAPIFGSNPLNVLDSQHILLFAKSFMERDALDPQRVNNCCYGISDAQGVFSFCAFNKLYRYTAPARKVAEISR